MKGISNPKKMPGKEVRVVQRGGRVFYRGQCYTVPLELVGKKVWLSADPSRVGLWLYSDTGKLLCEAAMAES